jgi:integrase
MITNNPENERIKRRYFAYLKEAKRYSEASLDGVTKALHRFESYTRFRAFRAFHIEQAIGFKRSLADQDTRRGGGKLSKATLHQTLSALRAFFLWLAAQPGYRSRLSYSDADYFNLSEKETRVAKAKREQRTPAVEQIQHVLTTMPAATPLEQRNRALIAFALLTGARDGALASFKLKHVDLAEGLVTQDAREVKTKFSKTFTTWFFPVGGDAFAIVQEWVERLRREHLWGPDDPLFPSTRMGRSAENGFRAEGLERKHWSTATPIRAIFRDAFEGARLPYFHPHSFRRTLALLGERMCRTPEEFKAWSQNLGHDGVLTTFTSYGDLPPHRQAEVIRRLAAGRTAGPAAADLIDEFRDFVRLRMGDAA